jgi:hypothetical protein
MFSTYALNRGYTSTSCPSHSLTLGEITPSPTEWGIGAVGRRYLIPLLEIEH